MSIVVALINGLIRLTVVCIQLTVRVVLAAVHYADKYFAERRKRGVR